MIMKCASTSCNLRCSYCYFDKVQSCSECTTCNSDDETLQLFIRQKINAHKTGNVIFFWQIQELTPDKLNFFKRVIKLQQQVVQGKKVINTVLINGVLLDDSWCEFFKRYQFIISISVNVNTSLHNNLCDTISDKPTARQIEAAVRLLRKHDVEFSTLTVINAINSQQPLQIYHYLKNLGSRHMQFIPLLEPLAQEGEDTHSLAPAALGIFLKTIFYTWVRLDIGTIKIPVFEHAFASWCGLPAPNCVFASFDVSAFTTRKSTKNQIVEQCKPLLAAECMSCNIKFACHGGCPKQRIAFSRNGLPALNYFCESYQSFFSYVEPYMLMMRALWEQNYAPSDIRQYLA
ncbi:TPA: radical SAM protein [Escherichia albertii]|uniref:radical SAM protein n=1 Tax=Escherichia albertii TaxID=208962 RepID=UPI00290F0FA9|nr:radical SAM protein [Escherichia albertii]HEB1323503.1 radical SAM protein [Escherichia albertii]HEB1337274.1 radical SAM protein [Escherichia albertii]HEB1350607.1 radical SAM protein [Escherichia albertii]HEB1355928.1 radical SAM protein [Escherichia albertii]